MSFSSSTVSIGASTKKSDYDRILDNTQYLKAKNVNESKDFLSSTVFNATATFNNPVTHNSGTVFNATATFSSGLIFPVFGSIGSLVTAALTGCTNQTEYLPGTECVGSRLVYSNETSSGGTCLSGRSYNDIRATEAAYQSAGLTGTWRLLSRIYNYSASNYPVGLFQRIS